MAALAPVHEPGSQRKSDTDTLREDPMDGSPQQFEADRKTEGDDDDVLIVDWDGPDDPENPKK